MDVGELHFVHFAEAAETPEDAADVDLENKKIESIIDSKKS